MEADLEVTNEGPQGWGDDAIVDHAAESSPLFILFIYLLSFI